MTFKITANEKYKKNGELTKIANSFGEVNVMYNAEDCLEFYP